MDKLKPFNDKLIGILAERNIPVAKFCEETGIDRASFFYKKKTAHKAHIYMGIAYYLGMDVHELVDGTEAVDDFWGR